MFPLALVSWCAAWHVGSGAGRGLEIDLIVETEDELLVVEIKFQNRFRGEFAKPLEAFQEVIQHRKPLRKIIVYTGDVAQKTKSGISVMPYQTFLASLV